MGLSLRGRNVSLQNLLRIANALNMPLSTLLAEAEVEVVSRMKAGQP